MNNFIQRPQIDQRDIESVCEDAIEHLNTEMKDKGRGAFVSSHECYGVLSEEMNKELLDAIGMKPCGSPDVSRLNHIYDELNDIVTTALFGMACIKANKMEW